jgi:hypothetical protein
MVIREPAANHVFYSNEGTILENDHSTRSKKQMRDGIETSWHPGKKKEPKIPGKILSSVLTKTAA